MDNLPRLPEGYHTVLEHGHMTWIDTTLQQILNDRILAMMARVLDRKPDVRVAEQEAAALSVYVNKYLWNEQEHFYFDRFRDGALSTVKTIGTYWALLAGVVPANSMDAFIAHLTNEREFCRPHSPTSLSADDPAYAVEGGYWLGSVWAPTTYMVLRGLTSVGRDDIARRIAFNHVGNVHEVFKNTGTLWENYAPERAAPGNPAGRDFVGWGGLPPIAVLFEYIFGLRPDAMNNALLWDVRLLDEHGVERYPFGSNGLLSLHCAARKKATEEPMVTISGNIPLSVHIRWEGGTKMINLQTSNRASDTPPH